MNKRETPAAAVFFIDVDNTLLDNDGAKRDIAARVLELLGDVMAVRFWELYEEVRVDRDVIEFFETFRRLRAEHPESADPIDRALHEVMSWDFRSRLYPGALETIAHLKTIGLPVVLSDGDPVFQPMKIQQSGINAAVDGRVLIFAHKEAYLPAVCARFPAGRYVLIDDKPGILMRSKAAMGDRLTTVHVRQGKYALAPEHAVDYAPDVVVERIGELLTFAAADFEPRDAVVTAQ